MNDEYPSVREHGKIDARNEIQPFLALGIVFIVAPVCWLLLIAVIAWVSRLLFT